MIQWKSANTVDPSLDLSLLAPVPMELDPKWLTGRVNGRDGHVTYFLLGHQERPVGYAPFVVHSTELAHRLGEITLFSVSVLRHAIQGTPLCRNKEDLPALFVSLRETIGKRGVVFFEGVAMGSHLWALLVSSTSIAQKLFHVLPHGPIYARRLIELPIGSDFDDYLAVLGSGTRKDVRRTRKGFLAGANGEVRMIRYTAPDHAADLAAALSIVSRKTYQHHLLGLGFENDSDHIEKFRIAAIGGWLRAYVLWIDDTPVAFQVGYRDATTYYGHHIGYDPAISKLQPGIYLHTEIMIDLLADDLCRFDFLSGDSLYKQRMSNSMREERHYYVIPRGWPGSVYASTLSMMNYASELIGRLLARNGLKERIRRILRRVAVKRSSHGR